jgi:hypothetical protein
MATAKITRAAIVIMACSVLILLPAVVQAQYTENVLYTFTGGADGAGPAGSLISDSQGHLYGVTTYGGNTAATACPMGTANPPGCGVVFELSPPTGGGAGPWTETVLYAFSGGADGGWPRAGLTWDSTRTNLIGATMPGDGYGWMQCGGGAVWQCGVIFELSPPAGGSSPWTETVLQNFGGTAGIIVYASMVSDPLGNMFGATGEGAADCGQYDAPCGGIFELSPLGGGGDQWTLNVISTLPAGGALVAYANDFAGVVMDGTGNLYGTTIAGGDEAACPGYHSPWGCGVVYELSLGATGWTENVLYEFTNGSDGALPNSGVALDPAGNVYGTTLYAGTAPGTAGCGVVFEMSPPGTGTGAWTETVLHTLSGTDGCSPAWLMRDSYGNLYGIAGASLYSQVGGSVFEMNPPAGGSGPWTYSVLYGFPDSAGGVGPIGPLLLDQHANLYGNAFYGGIETGNCAPAEGAVGCGVVFELVPPPTATSLVLSANMVFVGSVGPVVMTATVTAVSGSGTPTGTVDFFSGTTQIGSASLSNGVATIDYDPSSLATGTYSITAAYQANGLFAGSTSPVEPLSVVPITTTTSLTLSPSSVPLGTSAPVLMKATVEAASGSETPTGTVNFFNGTTQIGSVALSGGAATFSYDPSTLAAGTYSMTAAFQANGMFRGSTSSPEPLTVTAEGGFTLSVANTDPSVAAGQPITFTVTVTSKNGFTGPVSFSSSGAPLDARVTFSPSTVTLAAGGGAQTALTITTTSLDAGLRRQPAGQMARRVAPGRDLPLLAAVLPPAGFSGLAVLWAGLFRRKWGAKRGVLLVLTVLVLALSIFGWIGCGSNQRTYTITVTGTANANPAAVSSTTVTLVVR